MTKGISTAGTVHYTTTRDLHGASFLMQSCGHTRSQHAALQPVADDTEITCRRCAKLTAPAPAKTAPVRRTYGRQEWTLRDLRDGARFNGIKGATTMDGDALLAALVAVAPQWA
jgi:hypothetical protein